MLAFKSSSVQLHTAAATQACDSSLKHKGDRYRAVLTVTQISNRTLNKIQKTFIVQNFAVTYTFFHSYHLTGELAT